MNYPLKHISIRVPWHDTGWDGRVCADALDYDGDSSVDCACLKLKHIAEDRDEDAEESKVDGFSLHAFHTGAPEDRAGLEQLCR
ncbi:MAG: hypothetical protein CVU65_00215 [Deltaproteobacteria bacterium HGW-Deltaproteobacteria-22]|jgi:hypothetical protein|nr:MAG: hypothetical protein CVU65_00215 [Deltaproteobacteria bacterium HGW-Deltaproteobacteria-22]